MGFFFPSISSSPSYIRTQSRLTLARLAARHGSVHAPAVPWLRDMAASARPQCPPLGCAHPTAPLLSSSSQADTRARWIPGALEHRAPESCARCGMRLAEQRPRRLAPLVGGAPTGRAPGVPCFRRPRPASRAPAAAPQPATSRRLPPRASVLSLSLRQKLSFVHSGVHIGKIKLG